MMDSSSGTSAGAASTSMPSRCRQVLVPFFSTSTCRVAPRLLALFLLLSPVSGIPATPYNFTQQVDHFGNDGGATFEQRYYFNDTWFEGPGSPILCILGGEGAVPPSTGIFYPYVTDVLAQRFGALVIEPEHRFYGTSLPFGTPEASFTEESLALATPQQALADAADFIEGMRADRGCTARGTAGYCPAITIGGSYPGWLSAMMRLRYPAIVDGAYAASAPMLFYSQEVPPYEYYKVVTESAEKAVPGCADAVRRSLAALNSLGSKAEAAEALGLCEPLPAYLEEGSLELFFEEVNMVFMYTFADLNMANYPPEGSSLQAACTDFVAAADADPLGALASLLSGYGVASSPSSSSSSSSSSRPGRMAELAAKRTKSTTMTRTTTTMSSSSSCFNLTAQLPAGDAATISGGDWSGCGSGDDGRIWDLETCNYLVETIGTNNVTDMFPPREWTLDWLQMHCAERFGGAGAPQPTALADSWGFSSNRLAASGATRILFTNGLNDGWSAGGITEDVGEEDLQLLAVNMENGAHHSDLSHTAPDPAVDTPDVTKARAQIGDIIAGWLAEIMVAQDGK
jgi:dipeptidyl-peptidase-2